jgi:hypothetical protein
VTFPFSGEDRDFWGCRRGPERRVPSAARPGSLRRSVPVAALALAVLSATACGDSAPSGPAAAGTAELPPVPPPPDLALECLLPTPDASWEKARAQIGGAAAFLPKSTGGLVAVTLHFPIAVSEAIDGRSPAVCAASLATDGQAPRFVTGVHLRWPDRLLDGLTKGAEARFEVTTDPTTRIEVLKARDPKDAVMAAGVLGNYLLIAARAEDLTALGPYVARTMPTRAKDFSAAGVRTEGAAPPADFVARVPAAAMGGPFAAAGKRAWSRATEQAAGKLPIPLKDLADGEAFLAVLPDLEGADLRVTLDERGARIEASAPLRKGSAGDGRARALPAGDVAPLLMMPKDTLAAVLLRRALPAASAAGGGSPTASATPTPATAAGAPANTPATGSTAARTASTAAGTASTAAGTASAAAGTASAAAGTASAGAGTASAGAGTASAGAGTASAGAGTASTAAGTASAGARAAAAAGAGPPQPQPTLAAMLGLTEPEDAAKLDSIARAFDTARGDWLSAGFAFDGTGPSAFVRAAVRDGGALEGALADFVALADRASPRDPIKGQPVSVTVGKTVLENIPGDVYRLRLARGAEGSKKAATPPAAPTDTPSAVDVLFRRHEGVFVAATGYASRDVLRALLAAPSGENVRAVEDLAGPLQRLGADLSFAAFFDPARIQVSRAGRPGSATPAPVVVGLGRTTGDTVTVFAKIEASSAAVAELARWLDP